MLPAWPELCTYASDHMNEGCQLMDDHPVYGINRIGTCAAYQTGCGSDD
ncbi:MAG: hypothetical protein ACYTG7_25605 [Planctomycetota bacterium]